jgi:diacylglycerol kinase
MNQPFEWSARLRSFKYALRGIFTLVQTQHNARLHLFATTAVLLLGWYTHLDHFEWAVVVMSMALVWCAEALNTAVEFMCDLYSKEYHPLIEKSKDVAAGAVLVCAIGALIVGGLIFGPKLLHMWL